MFVNSEIFGVHEGVKDTCRRLAKAGYVVLAPDFFVRAGDPSQTVDMTRVMEIVKATPGEQVTTDTAALKFLAAQPYADMNRLVISPRPQKTTLRSIQPKRDTAAPCRAQGPHSRPEPRS